MSEAPHTPYAPEEIRETAEGFREEERLDVGSAAFASKSADSTSSQRFVEPSPEQRRSLDERRHTPKSRQGLFTSFKNAAAGVLGTIVRERNAQIELAFGIAAIVIGFVLHITVPEWLAIIVCIGLVIGAECINTSLEDAIDLVSPDYSELAGLSKDAAAGAVLVFAIASFIVEAVIIFSRLIPLILS